MPPEVKAMIETYSKEVDFIDSDGLNPIVDMLK